MELNENPYFKTDVLGNIKKNIFTTPRRPQYIFFKIIFKLKLRVNRALNSKIENPEEFPWKFKFVHIIQEDTELHQGFILKQLFLVQNTRLGKFYILF